MTFGKIFIEKWYTWEGEFHARTPAHKSDPGVSPSGISSQVPPLCLTLNGLLECRELLPKRFSDSFSV